MKYLYIPFIKEEAGDLAFLAKVWRSHVTEEINILYHYDDFDSSELENLSDLYVLAHGSLTDNDLNLYNAQDVNSDLKCIDPEVLAHRLQCDFINSFHRIKNIHLYCCGSFEKNYQLTRQLEAALIRETPKLHFYFGTITVPSTDGQAWSIGLFQNVVRPIEQSHFFLLKPAMNKKPKTAMKNTALKNAAVISFETVKQNNQNRFWKNHNDKKAHWIEEKRNQKPIALTSTIPRSFL